MKENENLENQEPVVPKKDDKPFGDIVGVPTFIIGDVLQQSGLVMLMFILVLFISMSLGVDVLITAGICVGAGALFKMGGDYLKRRTDGTTGDFKVLGSIFGYAPVLAAA